MPCYYCKKGIIFGRRHTHHRGVAGGRWKKRAPKTQRIFKVNLQPVHIMLDGKSKRVKLCTKCIKRIKKDIKEGKKPFLTITKLQKHPRRAEVIKNHF
jgi:large subunit ribosomal protein L28